MNKQQLIEEISLRTKLNKSQSLRTLEATIDTIVESLIRRKKERVSLAGFGTFSVIKRKGRKGVDPRTGKPIYIPETQSIRFKPAPSFKKSLNK